VDRHDSAEALAFLNPALTDDLGTTGQGVVTPALYAGYVRAEAYLQANHGEEAAAEYQKRIDSRGVIINGPIGALAHLGLGRAEALEGDTAKARVACQDFFALWKDADPDVPILIAAKAEYAKLH
jgi:hypothetical protein